MKILLLAVSLVLGTTLPPTAEKVKTLSTETAKSTLRIEGTSTLHDWSMSAENFKGDLSVDLAPTALKIHELFMTIPVKSLKSTEGAAMDKNAYKALKANDFETITFAFIDVKECKTTTNNCFDLSITGNLTIAGKTKTITLPMNAVPDAEGLTLRGETKITMSSYDVEAPSFLFGAMTTGDEITVKFSIQYK